MSGLFSILIYDEQIDRLYQQNRINSDAIGPTTKLNATQIIGELLPSFCLKSYRYIEQQHTNKMSRCEIKCIKDTMGPNKRTVTTVPGTSRYEGTRDVPTNRTLFFIFPTGSLIVFRANARLWENHTTSENHSLFRWI